MKYAHLLLPHGSPWPLEGAARAPPDDSLACRPPRDQGGQPDRRTACCHHLIRWRNRSVAI